MTNGSIPARNPTSTVENGPEVGTGVGAKLERVLDSAAVDFDDSPGRGRVPGRGPGVPRRPRHAEAGDDSDWSRHGASTDPAVAAEYRTPLPRVAGTLVRQRLGRHHLADGSSAGGAAPRPSRSSSTRSWRSTTPRRASSPRRMALVGPTIMAHGTPEQQQRYLGPLLRGDETWCQLFSEPGAGSDLERAGHAGGARRRRVRRQRARRCGTPSAQHAAFGILIARTNPDVPKHEGITYFIVDMSTPGHRRPPARAGPGRRPLQRGVPQRRAHPGRPTWWARSTADGRSRAPRCATSRR